MRRGVAFFLLLGLAALLNKSVRLDRPWTAFHDLVGARYSIIARNFVRDGFLDAPPVQKTHTGVLPPGVKSGPLTTHPPMVPLAVAVVFTITGTDSAWAARLAVIPAALLSLVLLALLARRLGSRRLAAATALFMTLTPCAAFYGAWVDPVGWWSMTWILAFFHVFLPWLKGGNAPPGLWRGPVLALLFVLAMLAEWNAVFLLPLIFMEVIFGGGKRRWVPPVFLGLAVILVYFIYRTILPTSTGYLEFMRKLVRFDNWNADFFLQLFAHYRTLFGWPVLLLAATGMAGLCLRAATGRISPLDRLTAALLLFQAYYAFLYPVGVKIHDFCSLYLLLPFSLLAARVFLSATRWVDRRLGRTCAMILYLLLVPWAHLSTRAGLEGWAKHDSLVHPIQDTARVFRESTQPEEIIATVTDAGSLVSERFYADRYILGGITTPKALEVKMTSPERPAVFILLKSDLISYPDLVFFLDASAPYKDLERHRVYDLRKRRTGKAGDHRIAVLLPPPDHVRTSTRGKEVHIRWQPGPGNRVAGYRIWFGNEEGVYPVHFDVKRPAFHYKLEARGTVHFVVAALDRYGRLGHRTPDQVLVLNTPQDHIGPVLAMASAVAVLLLMQLVLVSRRRRS